MEQPGFSYACKADTIPEGTIKPLEINGISILICKFEGRIYAVENQCSHADQPLECGRLRDGWISCPYHGARFDLESGEPLKGPAASPIETFPVRVNGDSIEVAV